MIKFMKKFTIKFMKKFTTLIPQHYYQLNFLST